MKYVLLFIIFFSFTLCADSIVLAGHFSPSVEQNVGVAIFDIDKNKVVLSHNYQKKFSYASNLKLLTTAASLHYLGGGFHFITLFHFDPSTATLSIKAGGDPSVTYDEIQRIAYQLQAKGVNGVKKVVVDNTMFGSRGSYPIPGSESGDNGYLAFLSPLSLARNAIDISVKGDKDGKPVIVATSARNPHFIVKNSATGSNNGENQLIIGAVAHGTKTALIVRGSLGIKRKNAVSVSRRVAHPVNHFVTALLAAMGEKTTLPITLSSLSMDLFSDKISVRHTGRPLREIVRMMNLESSNMIADSLVFTLGAIFKGDAHKGVLLLKEYAKNIVDHPVNIINGSGLGNGKNFIEPAFFIALLQKITANERNYIDFRASLPILGEDGTLKSWGIAQNSGKIQAKTGTLTGVTALSGFMKGKSGRRYLFTFVVNKFPSKRFKKTWEFRDLFLEYIRERL